jgi:hypothetical protein
MTLGLSNGPNRVSVSVYSPEEGNRSSFRKVVLFVLFEFRTMDKVLEHGDRDRDRDLAPACTLVGLVTSQPTLSSVKAEASHKGATFSSLDWRNEVSEGRGRVTCMTNCHSLQRN